MNKKTQKNNCNRVWNIFLKAVISTYVLRETLTLIFLNSITKLDKCVT